MNVQNTDSQVQKAILNEQKRQLEGMELIASENYQSEAVLQAQSSVFANKYSEWFPWKRYYWWQENTDIVEQLAIDRAKKCFHADHANVQALSGAAANICVYAALMEPWDTILWMDLSHWWHLTHWAPVTFLSKVFNFIRYKTLPNWEIDFDQVRKLAHQHKPKIILAWFSAYPRELDYDKFAEIAKEVGAVAFADVSHIWWFIAAWILKNPLDHGFHVMMTTTHKSLRWPRWALILSKWIVSNPLKKPENTIENIPTRIDRAVFPWIQWWPHMNTISAIAVALWEAQTDKFKEYATQALKNSKVMAEEFINRWYKLVTWWTDNHMIVVDFSNTPVENWKNAEHILDLVGISTSKSTIPDDPNPPFRPSGLRIWTPAMTTRWVKEDDIRKIVDFIDRTLQLVPLMKGEEGGFKQKLESIRQEVIEFTKQFPVPGIS
jgi:glycine hydroxymethyltransferase